MATGTTSSAADSSSRGSWAWALAGAIACAAVIGLEPSLLEEGLILHYAQRMVGGEHLYRDLVYFSGPLPFELLAALFRVFGPEIIVGRVVVAVLGGAATGATYAVARRAGAGTFAHAAAASVAAAPALLFPLFSTYFYTTLAVDFCILAVYAAVRGIRSPAWAAASGVLIACAALSKQNLGALAGAGLMVALVWTDATGSARGSRERWRSCGWLAAGGGAVALATVALFAARGDLGALIRATLVMPLALESSYANDFVNFWPPGRFSESVGRLQAFYLPHLYNILTGQTGDAPRGIVLLTQVLYALPFGAALAPVIARLLGARVPAAVWLWEAVLLALVANLYPRADWGHLVFVLPVAAAHGWLCIGIGLGRAGSTRVARAGRAAAAAAAAALAVAAASATWALADRAGPPTFGPRVPQAPVSRAYRSGGVPRVIRFLREHTTPGEAIFVARAEPLIYFATETRNPTPYSGVLPAIRDEQERTIVAALPDVRYVVMSEIDQPLFLYYRDELPAVQTEFERHYRVAEPFLRRPSWIVVLERGPDRGPAVADLFDLRATGRRFVLDAAGRERVPPQDAPALASRQNRRPVAFVLGEGGGGIDFELEIPPRAVFQADVGLRSVPGPDGTAVHANAMRLEVAVRADGESDDPDDPDDDGSRAPFRTLASEDIRFDRAVGATWRPVEIDLSAFAGSRITLRLQAIARERVRPGALAWWGSPRIVQRPTP